MVGKMSYHYCRDTISYHHHHYPNQHFHLLHHCCCHYPPENCAGYAEPPVCTLTPVKECVPRQVEHPRKVRHLLKV